MSEQQLDEEVVFHVARELTSSTKRAEYLDEACAGDEGFRERVERLLEVHVNELNLLVTNDAFSTTLEQSPVSESAGQAIGRFKLLQEIGEGGFGVVFMAEQLRPVRRKVALKVIKPGMDTKAVVARFEAERQALAMMDHPNIAKVLDGGTTASGRPYFVMELVKGVPINEFCDQNQLPPKERLDLFVAVCQAVQHAHQKGIIHRDLKPSNILVTLHDGEPVIKVIDFGIAKAISHQLTEKTLFTAFGQMVGTPQYMSPEQAEMSGLDVDTRSDIYSLGVLLYELLTGSTPLETERLREAGYAEVQRLVKESDPPKPSTRLSTSGDKLTVIAKHRSISPERLSALIKGDLDWVVMKALEKDRKRRYLTPVDLAEDVRRYLSNEPVEAYPPSPAYKLRKFVRRNRSVVVAGSSFVVVMLTAMMISWWGWSTAVAAREEAVAAQEEAVAAQKEAVAALEAKELALASEQEALADFREKLFEDGISAAFVVDNTELNIVKESWTSAGFEPEIIDLFEGFHELFCGDPIKAEQILKRGYEGNSESRPIAALYSMSLYGRNVDYGKREALQIKLRSMESEKSVGIENVLVGWSLLYQDSRKSTELLKPVLDRRWPIGWVMYSHALALRALGARSFEMAEEALKRMREAEQLLADDVPFAMTTGLWVRLVAYGLSDDPKYNAMIKAESDPLAGRLRGRLDEWQCYNILVHYFSLTDSRSLEQIYETVVTNKLAGFRCGYFYRIGNDQEALRYIDDNVEDHPSLRIASACVAAALGQREVAQHVLDQIKEMGTRKTQVGALEILLYLGELKKASEIAKTLKEQFVAESFDLPLGALMLRLELIANSHRSNEELQQILDELSTSEIDQCWGHYMLGLFCLAKDDPVAKEHFEAVVESNQFICPPYEMAKGVLSRRFGLAVE